MTFRNLCTVAFFVGLSTNINRPLGITSPPLLHNKRKCNHATKNTPGHAHAISVLNRDVSRGSSSDTLFAKLADRLLPDISPTHPHPAHPTESARGAGVRGSIPDRVHNKDIKTGRFALLSLALGINELGN